MFDVISRLNAALQGRCLVERQLGTVVEWERSLA
jgi:hypothetical protein